MNDFLVSGPPWVDRVVESLLASWEAVPLAQRWTIGMFVIASAVLSKWILPAITELVKVCVTCNGCGAPRYACRCAKGK